MTILEQFLEEGKQKGIEEGFIKGMEKGIELRVKQNKIEIAKKAIRKEMDTKDIIDLTGLAEKEIETLRTEILS